jgi:hypothetical protein
MAKKKETQEVAVKEEAGALTTFGALEEMSGQGFEGADKDAFAIPFLRILQSGSPQVDDSEPSYIEGAKPGMFFNTITGELYGKSVKVIPVTYGRAFIEWAPNRGGFIKDHGNNPVILDRVTEVDDKHNAILDNGNVIQDTRTHTVLLADNVHAGPVILSLTSSGIKHSKKWMTLMNGLLLPNTTKQAPMFASVWEVETVKNENDDGKWYQIGNKSSTAIKNLAWVNQQQLEAAVACSKMVSSGAAKADWGSTIDESKSSANGLSGGSPESKLNNNLEGTGDDGMPF